MGVEKKILKEGDGQNYATKGDTVTMEYTGWIYAPSMPDKKGDQFDSSVGRGDFNVQIDIGRVIKGWDEGISKGEGRTGMSLGEKATLTITPDYGYGDRGFPGAIPPNSTLVFDVELKAINGKKA